MKVVELKIYTEEVWQRFEWVFADVKQLVVSGKKSVFLMLCFVTERFITLNLCWPRREGFETTISPKIWSYSTISWLIAEALIRWTFVTISALWSCKTNLFRANCDVHRQRKARLGLVLGDWRRDSRKLARKVSSTNCPESLLGCCCPGPATWVQLDEWTLGRILIKSFCDKTHWDMRWLLVGNPRCKC